MSIYNKYNKSAFDITLDVIGWGVKTIVSAVANNIPTKANKEKKMLKEHEEILANLEETRRNVVRTARAMEFNNNEPLTSSIEEACDLVLFEKDKLLVLAKEIATYDPEFEILHKPVKDIHTYTDLPVSSYKTILLYERVADDAIFYFTEKDRTKREKEAWLKKQEAIKEKTLKEYKKFYNNLMARPNFKSNDPYRINYKDCVGVHDSISEFLHKHPKLEEDKVKTLTDVVKLVNKVYEISRDRIAIETEKENNETIKKLQKEQKAQAEKYQATIATLNEVVTDLDDRLYDAEREAKDAKDELEANDGSLSTAILTGMVIADHR